MGAIVQRKNKAWARRILPLCLCGFVGAVLWTGAPAHAQSNDVLNRIKRLENELDTLNRAVYKGEKPPVAAGGVNPTADLEVRIAQLEADLRAMTGKVEQQAYDNQQLQQRIDTLEQDSRMRLDTIEAQLRAAPVATPAQQPAVQQPQPGVTVDPNATPIQPGQAQPIDPDTIPQPTPMAADITGNETGNLDAAGLYEKGFAETKAQDFAAAQKSFTEFLKKYPDHALAPNALYWLGETFYVRKEYDQAARVFAEAYQKYPKGPKGADNLLKLGMSLSGKGEKDNACLAMKQIRKEYPNGPEPVLARADQEMATLGCK